MKNFSCGKRIKELRVKHKLSQERLALNAGITPVYLGLLERDQKNATVVVIEKICNALGIGLSEFFSENKDNDVSFDALIKCRLFDMSEKEKNELLRIIDNIIDFKYEIN